MQVHRQSVSRILIVIAVLALAGVAVFVLLEPDREIPDVSDARVNTEPSDVSAAAAPEDPLDDSRVSVGQPGEITAEILDLMRHGLPIDGCDDSAQSDDRDDSEQDFEQIARSAVELLSESDDPEYLLAAALIDFDRDEQTESPLLARAMAQLPDHPVALWHRLQHCKNESCNRGEIARAAVAADPTNGLLWLEIASGHLRAGDSFEAEGALRRAIASSRFDTYFIDYAELIERGLAASTEFDYEERIVFGIGVAAAIAIPSFGDVSRACRSEENDMVVWVPLCEELGKSMHEHSRELISSMMGWGFRKIAAERAGDDALARNVKEQSEQWQEQYIARRFRTGASVLMENDPAVLRQYIDDFRSHGELQAMDRLVETAERLRNDENYDQCNFVKRPYEDQ